MAPPSPILNQLKIGRIITKHRLNFHVSTRETFPLFKLRLEKVKNASTFLNGPTESDPEPIKNWTHHHQTSSQFCDCPPELSGHNDSNDKNATTFMNSPTEPDPGQNKNQMHRHQTLSQFL